MEELFSSAKFNWKIENFSKLNSHEGYTSDVFSVGPFNWKAIVYPKGQMKVFDHLSLFIGPVGLTKSVHTNYSFVITSQTDCKNRVRYDSNHEFTKIEGWGKKSFIRLSELYDPDKGYIVNDTCFITIELSCSTKENFINGDGEMKDGDPNEAVNSVTKKQKLNDGTISVQSKEYPGAGRFFDEGRHNNKFGFCEADDEFEDVGGFSILKTQLSLYKQIWSHYGHIPSIQVMPISSYPILVVVVKDLMNSIIDMHQCRYVDLTSEMVSNWEEKIKMAESIKFNVGWLRERFENVKKCIGGMQKRKTELMEHGRPLRAAKSRVEAAGDELKKAEAQLAAAKGYLRENISELLSESDMEMYLDIGESLLLEGLF